MEGDVFPPPDVHPQLQSIETIQAAHPLAIDEPAFAAQQHPDPLVPKPRSDSRMRIRSAD